MAGLAAGEGFTLVAGVGLGVGGVIREGLGVGLADDLRTLLAEAVVEGLEPLPRRDWNVSTGMVRDEQYCFPKNQCFILPQKDE